MKNDMEIIKAKKDYIVLYITFILLFIGLVTIVIVQYKAYQQLKREISIVENLYCKVRPYNNIK